MDPWDPGTAYILAKNQWIACRSKMAPLLSRYTETEKKYLFAELEAKAGRPVRSLEPHQLAEWLHVLNPKNFDKPQFARQAEMKGLYRELDMAQDSEMPEPLGEGVVLPSLLLTPGASYAPSQDLIAVPDQRPLEDYLDDYSLF